MTSTDVLERNLEIALSALDQLRGQGCRVVCFPENALYLRIRQADTIAVSFNLKEKFWGLFQSFANSEKATVFIGSAPIQKGRKLTNATVVIEPKKRPRCVYEKIHLFDVDVEGAPPSRESDHFVHGQHPVVLKVDGWRVGLSICYDLRFSELYNSYSKKNVHLILVPAAFLVPTGLAHWHALLRARAIESQSFVVAAAQCGGHVSLAGSGERRETFGHSLVVGPWGDVQVDMEKVQNAVRVVEVDPLELRRVRKQIPMSRHRRLKSS